MITQKVLPHCRLLWLTCQKLHQDMTFYSDMKRRRKTTSTLWKPVFGMVGMNHFVSHIMNETESIKINTYLTCP